MGENKLYSVDGILWSVDTLNRIATPICPKDYIGLSYDDYYDEYDIWRICCVDCGEEFKLKRCLLDEKRFVVEKVKAISRRSYDIVDIDGIQTPVTKKVKLELNNGYFCTAQVRDSKRGPQIVIYAGKEGSRKKSQIFITPEERRLSFDQHDLNPADVFARITAEFRDGTSHEIVK